MTNTVRNVGWALVLSLAVTSPACSTRGMPAPQPDAIIACTSMAQCDDHIACTLDNCDVTGTCTHVPDDTTCPSGQRCQPGIGCSATMPCTSTTQCDDMIPCTVDTCTVMHTCTHQPIDGRCMAPTPVCNPTMGCVAGSSTRCTTAAECDSHVACVVDACGVNMMCTHTPVDSRCTAPQRCTPTGCATIHACAAVTDCMSPSFWSFCDGDPTCSPEFGCRFPTPRVCDDGNRCHTGMCDRRAGTNGACVFACDRAQTGCSSDPACAVVGVPCQTGLFNITPVPSNHCASGMTNYDVAQVTFTLAGGMLVAAPGPTAASFGSLTDPAPMCPSFSASAVVPGGVTERYTLAGTFTDANHFTGTFTANYGGLGILGGCAEGSTPVTGTRM